MNFGEMAQPMKTRAAVTDACVLFDRLSSRFLSPEGRVPDGRVSRLDHAPRGLSLWVSGLIPVTLPAWTGRRLGLGTKPSGKASRTPPRRASIRSSSGWPSAG